MNQAIFYKVLWKGSELETSSRLVDIRLGRLAPIRAQHSPFSRGQAIPQHSLHVHGSQSPSSVLGSASCPSHSFTGSSCHQEGSFSLCYTQGCSTEPTKFPVHSDSRGHPTGQLAGVPTLLSMLNLYNVAFQVLSRSPPLNGHNLIGYSGSRIIRACDMSP
jgi:hypothetical protein